MEGVPWLGEIGWLPLIREHEELVEADFQRFYHIDYRDRYRPGGGLSRLTLRRLLALVDGLPAESLFRSEVEDRMPVSEQSAAIGDVISAFTGKKWHRWDAKKKLREEAEFKKLIEAERDGARAHNQRFLQARMARKSN